jgi:hypothetical protein
LDRRSLNRLISDYKYENHIEDEKKEGDEVEQSKV